MDLGLEGSLLSGMVGGYVTGLLSGILISIPAVAHGELMTMLLFAGVGVLGGLLRDLAPEKEDVWRFSPIFSLNPRRLRQRPYQLRLLFQLGCLFSIIFSGLLRVEGCSSERRRVSGAHLEGIAAGRGAAAYASSVFAVMIPLKIWNNTRNEKKLEAQQLRLNEARLAALTSQINPHFLFNTLNSVSSLIRTNPEQARSVVYRLSSILRRLLRKTDNLTPLRDELAFIDNYMTIEMVRFGEKLRFVKEIDPDTLDRLVPSMLLQPLIENSIRHGLATQSGRRDDPRAQLPGRWPPAPGGGGRRRRHPGSAAGDAVRAGHRREQRERADESAVRAGLPHVDRQQAGRRNAHRH